MLGEGLMRPDINLSPIQHLKNCKGKLTYIFITFTYMSAVDAYI